MSCCGSKRQSYGQVPEQYTPKKDAYSPVASTAVFVKYKYTGLRAMTVTGGITGTVYRFAQPGSEVMVDKRDAPGMAAVPNVEKIRLVDTLTLDARQD